MTRFYEKREDCRCPALEELWEQIKKVDDAQAEAQEYAEAYVSEQARYVGDPIFMNALRSRIAVFAETINAYQKIFVRKWHDSAITFELNGKHLTVEEAINAGESSTAKCATCGTQIPHLKYPGWNQ